MGAERESETNTCLATVINTNDSFHEARLDKTVMTLMGNLSSQEQRTGYKYQFMGIY